MVPMKRLALRTILPAFLAIGLFSGVVFFSFLPSLSRAVMDQKRLMIRELTDSSWNILARFEAEERAGRLTRAQAQTAAIEQVRSLHYGQEGKDYFWINDTTPRMIVHPYRPDLEGQDLSNFADPHGKLMFVEMSAVVARDGAGYGSSGPPRHGVAQPDLFDYVEMFYNPRRRHSHIGNISPEAFERASCHSR